MIAVTALTKIYGTTTAVNRLSFGVAPGEILAAVLLLECLAATWALGRVLDGTDASAIERPD